MKIPKIVRLVIARLAILITALIVFIPQGKALDTLTNGLVAYWPMQNIEGGVVTPDKGPLGLDLQAYLAKAVVPFNGVNVVIATNGGPRGGVLGAKTGTNAIVTTASQNTIIGYIAPVTQVSDLTNLMVPPLNQPNWTISFWVKASTNGPNIANRIFAIAESPLGNAPNLLWDITVSNQGDPLGIGHFRRQVGLIINGIKFLEDNGSGDQVSTTNTVVWDDNWHNITIVGQMATNAQQPEINVANFGTPLNGFVTINWAGFPLDVIQGLENALGQVSQPQAYLVQRSTNLATGWETIANAGNGATFQDNTPTNENAFYRVQRPMTRVQRRALYVDGQPAGQAQGDSIEAYLGKGFWQSKPAKNGAQFRTNGFHFADTLMFGGFLRAAGEGGFVNASYSEAAIWNRALSASDVAAYIADGITNANFPPLVFANLKTEYPAVAQGDTTRLSWTAAKAPATLNITPNVGDVTPISNQGIGATNTPVTSNTVYQLVATRASVSATGTVAVACVSNVSPNWRYIDSFTYLNDAPIAGQGNWLNPPNGPATLNMKPLQVHTAIGGNKLASFDGFWVDPGGINTTGNGGVAGRSLGSYASTVGNTNTLFFRFYIDPAATNYDIFFGQQVIDFYIGLNDLGVGDQGFNYGGPAVRLFENNPVTPGPIDLQTFSGTPAIPVSTGTYSYLTDPNTGDTNGIIPGKVYSVWIDVINRFPGVIGGFASGGEQTNAVLYSVWLQREDWPSRTNLFSSITCTNIGSGTQAGVVYPTGYLLSNRDYSINDQRNVLLGPSATLNYAAVFMPAGNSPQMTNGVRFDDFFISKSGLNSSVPVTAGSFITP